MNEKLIRVLYVDDYPLDRALVRDALVSDEGKFDLSEASSRAEFDFLLEAKHYDLVLSDFNILGFTGLQVLDAVQKKLPGTPVIIVTGTGSEEVAAEAIKRGAADYVIKSPSHIRRLPYIIKSALEAVQLRSDRLKAQLALQDSEELLRQAQRVAHIGNWKYDVKSDELYWSDELYRIYGLDHKKTSITIAKNTEMTHPDDRDSTVEIFQKALKNQLEYEIEFRIIRPDNDVRYILSIARIETNTVGDILSVYGTAQDVTDRKLVEHRLMAQRQDYETILDAMLDMIWYFDQDGGILRANVAAAKVVGLPFEELIGKTVHDLFPRPQAEGFLRDIREVYETRQPKLGIIEQYQTAAGENLWALTDKLPYVIPDGTILGVIAIVHDITKRKMAEDARTRSQQLLLALSNAGHAVQRALKPELIYELVGEEIKKLGYHASVVTITDDLEHLEVAYLSFPPDMLKKAQKLTGLTPIGYRFPLEPDGFIQQLLRDGNTVLSDSAAEAFVESLPKKVKSTAKPLAAILTSGTVINAPLNVGEEPIGLLTVMGDDLSETDIPAIATFANQAGIALKNAQIAEFLRQSKETAENYLNVAAEIIISLDTGGNIALLNESGHRLLGYEPGELIGKNWFSTCIPEKNRDEILDVYENLLQGKVDEFKGYENPVLRRDGSERMILWHNTLLNEDEKTVGLLSSGEDITERKLYEQEILRNREELRILTTRLAEAEENERRRMARELHDQVGQSLAVLGFNLNMIRDQVSSTLLKDLPSVEESISLVDEVTQNIRDVMDDLRPSVLDDYGLFSALSWYGDRFFEQTGVETRVIGKSLEPRLVGNIENALFRITQEALVNVTRHAKARQVTVSLKEKPGLIELKIQDDGTGFEESIPVDVGKRRGWGLVNMRERAESIGGTISIDAIINQGTIIKVVVPKGNS